MSIMSLTEEQDPFFLLFLFLSTGVVGVKLAQRASGSPGTPLNALGYRFLAVFCLLKLSDWMQGPYFYEVYSSKVIDGEPLSQQAVAHLFLAGFLSSAVIGTFVAGIVDTVGRRNGCLLFCVLYIASALSVHSDDYILLMLGRVCGGVATSLMSSAPEAWLNTELRHAKNLPNGFIGSIFGWMYFADSVVAIVAGLIAASAAERYSVVGPFNVTVVVLVVALIALLLLWNENYGGASKSTKSSSSSFSRGLSVIKNNRSVMFLGLTQAFFEAAMYLFVLLWVPCLITLCTDSTWGCPLQFGVIFSCFMVCCMLGSSLFGLFSNTARLLQINILVAAAAMVLPLFIIPEDTNEMSSNSLFLVAASFCVFEGTVGIYFPAIGTLRAIEIPDDVRAVIMNYMRIPLNALVVGVFMNMDALGTRGALTCAASFLFVAFFSLSLFMGTKKSSGRASSEASLKESKAD